MQMRRIPGRVVLFAGTLILLGAIGVRADRDGDHHRRVEVTFTKWVLNGGAGPLMLGVTGGDAEGVFAGEVLGNVRSARVPSVVNRLEVIYEVQAGDRSFTALLYGGQYKAGGVPLGGVAHFSGIVLGGWRAGSPVRAEWVAMQGPVSCPAPPEGAGALCFVGTITIERPDHDDDDR